MKQIKYICYYDRPDSGRNRSIVLAATNKLDYIFEVLNRNGFAVDIISMALNGSIKYNYEPSVLEKIGSNTLKLFGSFGGKSNPLFRIVDRLNVKFRFFLYLIKNTRRNEEIIVYHSLGYARLLKLAQKIKGFKIIGEIEEIYQHVKPIDKSYATAEYDFFDLCSKYIFPTSLLNDKLNSTGKPHVIIHGTYKVESIKSESLDDAKIHVVYAGTFDPNKGGAAAAAAAAYLPEYFHIHILGFGNSRETKIIRDEIEQLKKNCKASISFHGLLKGDEYIQFIQNCQIGLSTQNPKAAFNATSFPSKILSYMANGLKVVSIRIPAIENSAIGEYLFYYDEQKPEEIAKAIIKASSSQGIEPRQIIANLDIAFGKKLKMMLEK